MLNINPKNPVLQFRCPDNIEMPYRARREMGSIQTLPKRSCICAQKVVFVQKFDVIMEVKPYWL